MFELNAKKSYLKPQKSEQNPFLLTTKDITTVIRGLKYTLSIKHEKFITFRIHNKELKA